MELLVESKVYLYVSKSANQGYKKHVKSAGKSKH
jgi:hypothetical protein